MNDNNYYVYMIRCRDDSIYTGIAKNLERRIKQHFLKDKNCAKYTKSHEVEKLEIAFLAKTKKDACSLEYHIKKLRKNEKEEIIKKRCLIEKIKDKVNFENFNIID